MKRLSWTGVLAYSMGSFAAGLFYAFNNFTLPLYLSRFTSENILIGWLSSTRSAEQAIIQPLVGAWSDRTSTRFGRRAPFFLFAMPLSALLFVLTALLPHQFAFLPLAVLGIFGFSLLFNIGVDPYVALLADVTDSKERGTVNGVAAFFGFFAQFGLLFAAALIWGSHPEWVFFLVAAGLVIGFVLVALGVREPRLLDPAHRSPARTREPGSLFSRFARNLRARWAENREAVKLLGVRFLFQIGINAALPFLTKFVATEIGTTGWPELANSLPVVSGLGLAKLDPEGLAQLVAAFLLLFTMLFALPAGWLGDQFGKKRMFALGLAVMGLTAFFAAFATTIPQLLGYLVLLGFGNALQTILFFPYLSDLVPADRIGEYQGLSATAETAGIGFSVLLAGALLDLNVFGLKYRLIFLVTGFFLMLGVFAVAFVKARLEPGAMVATGEPAHAEG